MLSGFTTAQVFGTVPVANFEVHVRVNLDDETQARDWVDSLFEKTKCTYRVSHTYKPSLKCVTFKINMHCQHFRKPLTKKQQQLNDQKKEISYFVVFVSTWMIH